MKKSSLLILVINLIPILYSYSQPTFSRRYNLPITFAKLIDAAPDGGYYFCGGNSNVIVGKIDSLGNLQWAKQIGLSAIQQLPYDLVVLNNGNAVAIIRWYDGGTLKTYLISFDLMGNLIFCKRYANANTGNENWPDNLIKDGNGFCFAVSNYPINETRILKADSVGNKLGSVFMPGSEQKVFKNISGNYFLFPVYSTEITLFNSSLIYQGSIYSGAPFCQNYGMIQISNSSYMIYGDDPPFISKINSQLLYEWQKYYDISNLGIGKIAAAQIINSNKIAFYGQGENSNSTQPYIFEIDTLGNPIDCKLITTDGLNPDDCPSECVFKDNRLTFMYNEIIPSLGNYFKIVSVDSSLSQICNAVDTIMNSFDDVIDPGGTDTYTCGTTNDSLITDSLPIVNIAFSYGSCNDSTLSVNSYYSSMTDFIFFPNPFSDILNITANKGESTEIILYDIASRKILEQKFVNYVSINTEQFAKGIYIYEVRDKNGLYKKGKVVKD
jgi:hypothetical protein